MIYRCRGSEVWTQSQSPSWICPLSFVACHVPLLSGDALSRLHQPTGRSNDKKMKMKNAKAPMQKTFLQIKTKCPKNSKYNLFSQKRIIGTTKLHSHSVCYLTDKTRETKVWIVTLIRISFIWMKQIFFLTESLKVQL